MYIVCSMSFTTDEVNSVENYVIRLIWEYASTFSLFRFQPKISLFIIFSLSFNGTITEMHLVVKPKLYISSKQFYFFLVLLLTKNFAGLYLYDSPAA